VATQPTNGLPAFLRYPSFDEVFSKTPPPKNKPGMEAEPVLNLLTRNIQRPNDLNDPNDPNRGIQRLLDTAQARL
jgi:hypothetical protein